MPRLPNPPLKNFGQWIVDADGLVVIVRGVNMINKFPPYTLSITGFGDTDALILAANGFNAVRVGVIYTAVEPTPGRYDDVYLADIKGTVDMLAGKGIMSLIDFHQDAWGPAFNGEGFPEWATLPPGNELRTAVTFPALMTTPEVEAAFDNFWSNTTVAGSPSDAEVGLQERFAQAWAHAVGILKGPPDAPTEGILGWEILNEPYPANSTTEQLRQFTQRVVDAIRAVDTDHMIWYEPWVTFDSGAPTDIGKIYDPHGRIGMAFHNYVDIASGNYEVPWENAVAQSMATSDALLVTEFGGIPDRDIIAAQMNSVDGWTLPAIYWAYWNRTPYVIDVNGRFIDSAEMGIVDDLTASRVPPNLKTDMLDALTRPYPMFIAGRPLRWNYDPVERIFELLYVPIHGSGPTITEIFVPDRHYPNNRFSVSAVGNVSLTKKSQAVVVETLGWTPNVQVRITPS